MCPGSPDLIIDYASARLDDEPFFTSPTEGAVQWLLHRRMGAQQQMRWSPRGAHLMLQVRTLKNPLICQTGPKTSAKSGWSCSIWEKRCISGPSQSSRMVGSRS